MAPFKTTSSALIGSFVSELEATETRRGAVATSPNPFTPGNGYIYHIFTAPGNFTVTTSGYIDLLLVGGGGGGGKGSPTLYKGGGGGAGAFREEYNIFCPEQSYTITIGSGGSGATSFGWDGNNGGWTRFSSTNPFRLITNTPSTSLYAPEGIGGGGSSTSSPSPTGASTGGGEGGGHLGGPTPGLYGNRGGGGNASPYYSGGGGGGAYSLGRASPSAPRGGDGGDGRVAFAGDTGIPTGYGAPGPPLQFGGNGRCFAGGGGGAGHSISGSAGQGGGGGGNGGSATTNTGSGGGGSSPGGSGGDGAPGIVIVRVKVNPT